jgi:hypothetical protein
MEQWEVATVTWVRGLEDFVAIVSPEGATAAKLKDFIKQLDLKDKVAPNQYGVTSYLLSRNWEPISIGVNEFGELRTWAFRRKVSDRPPTK